MATVAAPAGAEPTLKWNEDWPRFRTTEAVVTGLMLLPIAGALFLYPNPDDNIHGGVLWDNAVRDALVADTRDGRGTAAKVSNFPYLGLLAYPVLVDVALVTWGIHGAGDVALEMLAMDLESFAITGAVALTFQKMGRVRPAEKGCATDPNYATKCSDPTALNQSFISGHTAVAFTGAGLTCAHHRNLPLYGGGAPDVAICVAALAAATTTGVLRIVSDDHWSTDVLLGVGLGLVSGWGLPEWLHYGGGAEKKSGSLLPTLHPEGSTLTAVLAPQLGEGFLGLTLVGGY
ncbi:MAG TPA: phosphatase PAP2 family protein [Polyangiaceae bacterium]|nr:phosphatase PAP2 family protein [Polyangiaceae bacterium]